MIIHFENDLNGKRHGDRLEAERERGGFGGVHKKIVLLLYYQYLRPCMRTCTCISTLKEL